MNRKEQERLAAILDHAERRITSRVQGLNNRLVRLERHEARRLPPGAEAAHERQQEHLTRLAELDRRRRE